MSPLPAGFFNTFDIQAYRKLVLECPVGSTLVEAGAYRGRSLCAAASELLAREMKVIAVDTCDWSHPDHANLPPVELDLRSNLSAWGLSQATSLIKGDAHVLGKPDGLHMVFLDDNHRFEHVMRAIYHWWPLLPDGGILAGHDYAAGIGRLPYAEMVAVVHRSFGDRDGSMVYKPVPRSTVWSVTKRPGVALVPEPEWLACVAHPRGQGTEERGQFDGR